MALSKQDWMFIVVLLLGYTALFLGGGVFGSYLGGALGALTKWVGYTVFTFLLIVVVIALYCWGDKLYRSDKAASRQPNTP